MVSQKTALFLLLVCYMYMELCSATPILGYQTIFEDNSKVQGKSKPIFVFCDEIGTHLNCILYCKNMGHNSGHCSSDFTCNCL